MNQELEFLARISGKNDREDLIELFAEYKIVPVKSPQHDSPDAKMQYTFQRRGSEKPGNKHVAGRETTKQLIQELGISTDRECESVREEIKNHPKWGTKA